MNKIFCVSDIKNTGLCGCYFDPKLIIGGILVPNTLVLTDEQLAPENIAATFQELILAPKPQRIFPFIVFSGVTDSTEDPTIFTSGYGTPVPVREGSYNWIFDFLKGGVNLNNALRSFNGLTGKYSPLFVESTNKLIGTKKMNADGVMGTAGIPLDTLYTFPWKLPDGTNPAGYRTQVAFRPEHINENIAFHAIDFADFTLATLNGLDTVALELAEQDGLVYTITGTTDCGSNEAFDLYGTELAQVGAWTGVAVADGETIAPASVTANAAAGGWDITFSEEVSSINLAPAATLAAAPINVVGYEGEAVEIEVGSGS